MKMSVNRFKIVLQKTMIFSMVIFLCCGCVKQKTYKKVELPTNACRPIAIKTEFVEVVDLQSAMKNQELSRVYFYSQKKQMESSVQCYEVIINEFNK